MIDCKAQAERQALVKKIRQRIAGVLAVYAFGSRITGTAQAHSDLDLAVLVAGYADPVHLFELAGELEEIAGCPVDLLDLRAASTVMQSQVLHTGLCWWAKDPVQTALFEMFILSEKMALDEARAGLLADIRQRGRIYA